MTMYNEPEFKVVVAKTEDVLTASPIVETNNMNTNPNPDDRIPFSLGM